MHLGIRTMWKRLQACVIADTLCELQDTVRVHQSRETMPNLQMVSFWPTTLIVFILSMVSLADGLYRHRIPIGEYSDHGHTSPVQVRMLHSLKVLLTFRIQALHLFHWKYEVSELVCGCVWYQSRIWHTSQISPVCIPMSSSLMSWSDLESRYIVYPIKGPKVLERVCTCVKSRNKNKPRRISMI